MLDFKIETSLIEITSDDLSETYKDDDLRIYMERINSKDIALIGVKGAKIQAKKELTEDELADFGIETYSLYFIRKIVKWEGFGKNGKKMICNEANKQFLVNNQIDFVVEVVEAYKKKLEAEEQLKKK